jgi:hypothetical protein
MRLDWYILALAADWSFYRIRHCPCGIVFKAIAQDFEGRVRLNAGDPSFHLDIYDHSLCILPSGHDYGVDSAQAGS